MKKLEKLLEAITHDLDAITFWHTEDGIIPIEGTKTGEENEPERSKIRPFPCEVTIG